MSISPFIHLKVHSAYSLAEGAIRTYDLIDYCQQHRMPAIALTDTMNVFGAMEFSLAAAKAGVQPIIGAKVVVASPLPEKVDKYRQNMTAEYEDFIFLAATEQGYKNLIKLLSRSYLQQRAGTRLHIPFESLGELNEGLLVLSGGSKHLHQYFDIFKDRFYLEIGRFGLPHESQREEHLIRQAQQLNIPLVATNEAFFLTEEQYEAHDALLCIADGAYISQSERRQVTPHHRLKTPAEMLELFKDLPEAIANTHQIARRCSFVLEPVNPKLPPFPTPKGETEELYDQAHEGLKTRLALQVLKSDLSEEGQAALTRQYKERLDFEIGIINKMGYAGYYLIVADFIKWAKQHNIPVGPGRGSGAGSLVAWSLTITDVDPIALNLLFERFLNPERISMPDFDIDFCQDRRDEVIDYVCEKYGSDRVAQIITFGKLQARAALRDVGRVTGMPYNQVDQLCKLVPNNPTNPVTLKEAIEQEPALKEHIGKDATVKRLFDIALKLEGLYRHASTHAAGVVIGGEPLENIVALYHDGESKLPATQFNMKYVELTGLVKLDFLGLKTLTVMQKAVDLLRHRGIELALEAIPLDDAKTFEMLQRVEAVGVFQLESAGMRDVLRKLQPTRFEEIIALVALYRPGPMDDIPRYLACKHGEEAITYAHPLMEDILKETFGVMVYQEQVMQIAQKLAGYSLGQADLLRRAMGKKIKAEMDAQREIFIKGCHDHSQINQTKASQIFDQMAKFASYGFNKCHSAPYGLIAYQTAYLKANYPVEYLAALMTFDAHNTDKLNIGREELLRLKIPLLPPDVNKSFADFHVEMTPEGIPAVRYALGAIKNIGKAAMEALVAERQANGVFEDVFDFARRLDPKNVNKRMLESLIAAGAFDSLEPNRARLMGAVDLISTQVGEQVRLQNSQQQSLFAQVSEAQLPKLKLPELSPWTSVEKSQREFEAIGFYLSEHPLDGYQEWLKKQRVVRYQDLFEQNLDSEGSAVNLAGVILATKERLSKSGQKYAFIQLSDTGGLFEGVVFSDLYASCRDLLESGNLLFVRATARQENETIRLTIQEIQKLDQMLSNQSAKLKIALSDKESIARIHELLVLAGKGNTKIALEVKIDHFSCKIELADRYQVTPQTLECLKLLPKIDSIEMN